MRCRQFSSLILAKLFSFINLAVDKIVEDHPLDENKPQIKGEQKKHLFLAKWQDAWSVSAHARCRQLSSQILAKLFSFMNIFGVDSRLGAVPKLFCVLRDL